MFKLPSWSRSQMQQKMNPAEDDPSDYLWLQNYGSFFDDQPHKPWYTESLPINRMFAWYKASLKAPLGLEPVVVDLQGLGKGHAYVNGQSIGRYWPSFLADEDGYSINFTCDYRGPYNNNKCLTNCGQPSQRPELRVFPCFQELPDKGLGVDVFGHCYFLLR
ncbi:hypothetical protein NE237_023783 [Protea cynaroides]|uniref:Beta-galactosidase galactose-binding domain-containing protein n=1 Tax=Protea cynaroides TaxID=273540 RepID=A0A9Q0K4S7_9MAGN|nr:hypothetical protein NE237_023783 [Protea cynaroides]